MNFYYEINDSGDLTEIIINNLKNEEITDNTLSIPIPKYVRGITVLTIGVKSPSKNCFITSTKQVFEELETNLKMTDIEIVIPNTVEKINIISVDDGFFKTSPKSLKLKIPNSVNKLAVAAFENIPFSELSFGDDSNIEELPDDCFKYSSFQNKFMFPKKCRKIGVSCFEESHFYNGIDFENSNISIINQCAFSNADVNIENLVFPSTISDIESFSFRSVSNLIKIETKADSKLKRIGREAFCYCNNLDSVILKTSEKDVYLGDFAFYSCLSLTKMDLSGIKTETIPKDFCSKSGDFKLFEFKFPRNVKYILDNAFAEVNLNSIEFPATIVEIGKDSFRLSALEEIRFKNINNLSQLLEGAFSYNKLKTLPRDILCNLTRCQKAVFAGNEFEYLELLAPSKTINSSALFFLNIKLKKVVLINTIYNTWGVIWNSMFKDCYSLEEIVLPPTIKIVGEYAFQKTSITKIEVPNVEIIMDFAFNECEKLICCDLSHSKIKNITEGTFSKTKSLKQIKLPIYSTAKIHKKAFGKKSELQIKKIFLESPFLQIE